MTESMRACFTRVTAELMDTDERMALVLADIGVGSFREAGVFERHPHRAVNVGIREQLMVGFAAGLAIEGFRPILHSYAPFLVERPFEQLKLDFGYQGVGGILVTVGASYDTASEGRSHQCPGDVAVLSTLPGWFIHIPGHPAEVENTLRSASGSAGCAYVRLSERQNAQPHGTGAGLVAVRRGEPGAPLVIAVGPMLDSALAATADLDVTVAYTSQVRPFDAAGCQALAGTDVAIVEPYLEGTSAFEVSRALSVRPHRLLAIGVLPIELRRYGTPADHDRAHGLDAAGLRARLTAFLGAA